MWQSYERSSSTTTSSTSSAPQQQLLPFADLTCAPKLIAWSKGSKPWRVHDLGLNLEGVCKKDPTCPAHNRSVICHPKLPAGESMIWRLGAGPESCPMCDSDVTPVTAAVNCCLYRIQTVPQPVLKPVYRSAINKQKPPPLQRVSLFWSKAGDECVKWPVAQWINGHQRTPVPLWHEIEIHIRDIRKE